ncbi:MULTISPECIES: hypothetical protein [unclassified Arenibacter]|uniref:hypothetical protein n=1 Tax=unclassified Arenibacter TaxID=2615047 RepID=UPI000E352B0A|nr:MULTISPECIES: hypothetical protein [unclassified Arenibacter]MCM4162162.1 hypothetical protein [Arenibacter sp. A80]RFT57775.1 hypothetical protein D0S24_01000 [Arenibacter sp. P308M17]
MEKPVKEIRENYKRYEELIGEIKNTSIQTITLDELKGNHQNTRVKKVNVEHVSVPEKLELIIESRIENKKDFKFKLRAPEYTGIPFFRFDSDGVAHYNRVPDVELPNQKVETPHFHKFDSDGRNIAYKTAPLEKATECDALLNDISLCMAHYCDESRTYYKNEYYVEIIQTPPTELDFDSHKDNPTEGVQYE